MSYRLPQLRNHAHPVHRHPGNFNRFRTGDWLKAGAAKRQLPQSDPDPKGPNATNTLGRHELALVRQLLVRIGNRHNLDRCGR
jgi:hypothetical protein